MSPERFVKGESERTHLMVQPGDMGFDAAA